MLNDPTIWKIMASASFAFGACIGSFLNVVIWRIPRGESIVSPPSHCPKCGAGIAWYQNIPILSWLILGGKCAHCRAPISPRYILIETIGGVLFLAAFLQFGLWAPLVWVWLALMMVGSFIDFDHQLLPDFVTIGGMIYGFAISWLHLLPITTNYPLPLFAAPLESAIGLGFGFGLLWLVRYFGTKAFRREAMGMGDVLLMGAIGALFGPVAVLFTLIVSSLLGSIVGLGMVAMAKARLGKFVAIPYGPYICLAALAWIFAGTEIVQWYVRLLGFRG